MFCRDDPGPSPLSPLPLELEGSMIVTQRNAKYPGLKTRSSALNVSRSSIFCRLWLPVGKPFYFDLLKYVNLLTSVQIWTALSLKTFNRLNSCQ
ncbi:hypothetical protein XELAEV_18003959mg [Xenopus laevis]|uniref:Uncharacterized protein n=1 Tax=Xenopus laevis TaxID=8355 RepID=A0A974BRX1_XENLA|nr:hypothetical protein XELAEV_18003959mg [Xenopus laevis]